MYAAAATYVLATSANGAMLRETAGVGGALSGGMIAAVMAVLYGGRALSDPAGVRRSPFKS